MTGSPAAPGPGENTLTVSQSPGSAPGSMGDIGASRNPDCGGGGPTMAASRTPSQGGAGNIPVRTLWPPGRRLRLRVEQDDGNLARRGALLIIREIGHALLLRGP